MKKPLFLLSPHHTGKTKITKKLKNIDYKYKILDADESPIFTFDTIGPVQPIENCIYLMSLGNFKKRVSVCDCDYYILLPKDEDKFFKRVKSKNLFFPKKYIREKLNYLKRNWDYFKNHPNTIFFEKYLTVDLIKEIIENNN